MVLYSTHCPKCKILEKRLKEKNIQYEEVNDVDVMILKGIQSAPVLEIGEKLLDFKSANNYINTL